MFLHAAADFLAETFYIRSGGVAAVDEKVAMQLRDLRIADDKPAATCGVDQLPGFMAFRILEGRPAGTALDRLRRLARLGLVQPPAGRGCRRP